MFFLSRIRSWFAQRERTIFHYFDGTANRRADPVKIGSEIERVCPEYSKLLQTLSRSPTEAPVGATRDDLVSQQKTAALELAKISRKVFQLAELEPSMMGGGVTDAEAIRVLTAYFVFMESLAREAQLFGSSPEAA